MGVAVGDDVFVDQESGVVFDEGRFEVGEDGAGGGVGPVVEAGVDVVGSCAWMNLFSR